MLHINTDRAAAQEVRLTANVTTKKLPLPCKLTLQKRIFHKPRQVLFFALLIFGHY